MGKEEEIQELIQHYKKEFAKLPLSDAPPFDPRFPNQNQTRYVDFSKGYLEVIAWIGVY